MSKVSELSYVQVPPKQVVLATGGLGNVISALEEERIKQYGAIADIRILLADSQWKRFFKTPEQFPTRRRIEGLLETGRVQPIQLNILDGVDILYTLKQHGITEIDHGAAIAREGDVLRDPERAFGITVGGGYNVLRAAEVYAQSPSRSEGDIILRHLATTEQFGEILEGSHNETAKPNPIGPYGIHKAIISVLMQTLALQYYQPILHNKEIDSRLRIFIAVLSNIYGKHGDLKNVIPYIIGKIILAQKEYNDALTKGEPPPEPKPIFLSDNGKPVRQFTFESDAARGILALGYIHPLVAYRYAKIYMQQNGLDSEVLDSIPIVNVASKEHTSMYDLAVLIKKLMTEFGYTVDVPIIPQDKIRPGGYRRLSIDSQKLQDLTGWKQQVSLREGLRRCIQAMRRDVREGRIELSHELLDNRVVVDPSDPLKEFTSMNGGNREEFDSMFFRMRRISDLG